MENAKSVSCSTKLYGVNKILYDVKQFLFLESLQNILNWSIHTLCKLFFWYSKWHLQSFIPDCPVDKWIFIIVIQSKRESKLFIIEDIVFIVFNFKTPKIKKYGRYSLSVFLFFFVENALLRLFSVGKFYWYKTFMYIFTNKNLVEY